MDSFKKNLFVSAVAVALVTIAVHGESYEAKRLLRGEVAEAEEADDSECGSLDMAEEENTGSSTNNNNWSDTTQTTQFPSNTWSTGTGGSTTTQDSGTNTWSGGDNTWTSGGSTNTWSTGGTTTNTGTTEQTQFTQGGVGGDTQSSNINFNSFQNPSNVGTLSPQ